MKKSNSTGRAQRSRLASHLPVLSPVSHAVLCVMFGLAPLSAHALDAGALPTNGQIVAGSGSISSSGSSMTVTQNTDRMVTNWNTFNIGSGASVTFNQPSSSSVALNRVTSSDASQIMGALNANGQVYLVNPSGVLFGAGSSVNVGGLVASTLNISDANFMAGNNVFDLDGGSGTVINQGSIHANDGGYVALLGAQVRNEGTIVAKMGSVVLGAGENITLDFNGDGLINMAVSNSTLNASVVNTGLLQANGGTVLMTAHATDALLADVVNNTGVIEATSLQQRNGVVVLDGGSSGVVSNSGSIDVSGRNAGETGGTVKLLGEYVGMFDGSRIDASGNAGGGTVLAGGDYQGSGNTFQATATYMDANASISADALASGNGGKVILWSQDSTRFYGGISVTGGGNTGAGGLVETSGHYLDVFGSVNLSAASGQGGTWLLDPFNINITSAANAGGATSSDPFTSSGAASSNLSSATLNASLSEGANILVCTTSNGGTSGDINVLDNVKAVGNATLTLQAHRNITMTNTSITNADGKSLNVSLYSNFNNTGNGSVALSNATISTNGGNLTISGAVLPDSSYASTNVSNGVGVSITNGSVLTTNGGDISIRGATSSTLAAGSSATAVQITTASKLDAGGGNISIVANQASSSGTGDAFILTSGSKIVTNGSGSISIDSTNLGSGNATRIFSTNNTIAATGSGNVTISGNATSGFGVLICSTAATSSQNISVGSGNLTIRANSNGFAGAGRGVYLAASGTGSVTLSASAGGNIVIGGNSSGSYGTVLNSTGASSIINVITDGDITIAGNTSGGTTPALGLLASGDGTASAAGSQINVRSTAGNVSLAANNAVINHSSGAFKAISLDAGGKYAAINVGTQSGQLRLDGTSASGRGVDMSPSATNATVTLSTNSGDIFINGTSSSSFGGYGISFNSTNSTAGVNVISASGNISMSGTANGAGAGIIFDGSNTNGNNTVRTGGSGNMFINATGNGSYGLSFAGGTNNLQVQDGILYINASAPNGSALAQAGDITSITAIGSGVVIRNLDGVSTNLLTATSTAPTTTSVQSNQINNTWITPPAAANRLTPTGEDADRVNIDLASLNLPAADNSAAPPFTTRFNSSTESQDNEPK